MPLHVEDPEAVDEPIAEVEQQRRDFRVGAHAPLGQLHGDGRLPAVWADADGHASRRVRYTLDVPVVEATDCVVFLLASWWGTGERDGAQLHLTLQLLGLELHERHVEVLRVLVACAEVEKTNGH